MKLHEAIEKILIDAKKPLNINEIANQINLNDLYIRKDERIINRSQVSARVRQYKHLFQIINNQVFLISDNKWKDILSTYWYIADFLTDRLLFSTLVAK